MASTSRALYAMAKNEVTFRMGPEEVEAFRNLREALTKPPVLGAVNWDRPFSGQVDAGDYAIGGVLAQLDDDGHEHPLAFLSRQLHGPELSYDIREKECLALVWLTENLRPYLVARTWTCYTDHSSLRFLWNFRGNGRLARWKLYLLQCSGLTIEYKAGKLNTNADCLSRVRFENDTHVPTQVEEETA